MSTFSQFGGRAATTSVVNAFSSGGVSAASVPLASAREVLSGALTATTLKELLSVTGGGELPHLSAYAKDLTSRTVRLVVIADGVTCFDATSGATGANGQGILAAGVVGGQGAPIRFNSSLSVSVASSLSETDKVAIAYTLNRT